MVSDDRPNDALSTPLTWAIFCRVIDNHGDLGVCWRLARQLAARGHSVRLWVDDASALSWMAPEPVAGITVIPWTNARTTPDALQHEPWADVWVEAFGCEIATNFIAVFARHALLSGQMPPVWLNLEYLSAEAYVARSHALPSPIQRGPAAGWTKYFFYPGFTRKTGGLMHPMASDAAVSSESTTPLNGLDVLLFCYETPALASWLQQLANGEDPVQLRVCAGRPTDAVNAALRDRPAIGASPTLTLRFLPHCSQPAFDALLRRSDLNIVRGEDSLVQALWAGQPFIWHIYPQHDDAHHAKLQAFLDWLDAPSSLRHAHAVWNGLATGSMPELTPERLSAWRDCAQAARARLQAQDDLVTQLLRFVAEKR